MDHAQVLSDVAERNQLTVAMLRELADALPSGSSEQVLLEALTMFGPVLARALERDSGLSPSKDDGFALVCWAPPAHDAASSAPGAGLVGPVVAAPGAAAASRVLLPWLTGQGLLATTFGTVGHVAAVSAVEGGPHAAPAPWNAVHWYQPQGKFEQVTLKPSPGTQRARGVANALAVIWWGRLVVREMAGLARRSPTLAWPKDQQIRQMSARVFGYVKGLEVTTSFLAAEGQLDPQLATAADRPLRGLIDTTRQLASFMRCEGAIEAGWAAGCQRTADFIESFWVAR